MCQGFMFRGTFNIYQLSRTERKATSSLGALVYSTLDTAYYNALCSTTGNLRWRKYFKAAYAPQRPSPIVPSRPCAA